VLRVFAQAVLSQIRGIDKRLVPSPCSWRSLPYPTGGSDVPEIVEGVLHSNARTERVLFHAISLKPEGFGQDVGFGPNGTWNGVKATSLGSNHGSQ
jgi:hypothetical protein